MTTQSVTTATFNTFGDLLKFLRRRERLTQLDLSIAVGYSEAQISRLEQNQRLPDLAAVKALFIPALGLQNEPEIAARLIELAQSARQEDSPAPGLPPYKGLLYFDESDSDLFFGRETLTAHLANRITAPASESFSNFLAVVGASGSGKSSLARAGLAVTLKRAGWDVHIFTPTATPLRVLESTLGAITKHAAKHTLILVDQFEETFTLCRDESERIAFIEKLLAASLSLAGGGAGGEGNRQIFIVITLRADFYSHCAQYPLLRQAVAANQEYIGQMTTAELRRAIEEPAKRGGWDFEPGLVDLLLNDIGAHGTSEPEPGALPLLSHALLATWERRRGKTFTIAGYRASGGVRSAIAETAESVFTDQLNHQQQELARDVFLRLTELGEGTEDTRRRAALNELVRQAEEAAQLRAVLNTLAEARLITLNADSAEVSHEALIREWQRLHDWLLQDREGLRLHRHLTESAKEWEGRGRDSGELYRGARLAQVREWVASHPERLNTLERAFLDASLEWEQHEALERETQRQRELESAQKLFEAQKQATGRLRRVSYVLSAVLLIVGMLAGTSLYLRQQAIKAEAISTSRELAAASINNLDIDPERSMLLALQALSTSETSAAEEALHRALMASRVAKRFETDAALYGLAYSPDGTKVAAAGQGGIVSVWDVVSGALSLELEGHSAPINQVAFSPNGKVIASASDDSTVRLWDATTGQELFVLRGHLARVPALAFSPDGTRLATVSEDTTLRMWDVKDGSQIFVGPERENDRVGMISVAFSPDANQLATGSNESVIEIWDSDKNEPIDAIFNPGFDPIASVVFSPHGKSLVTSSGRIARVWDLETQEELFTLKGHTNVINGIVFNADGSRIVTAGLDRKIRVWDFETGQSVLTLSGHQGAVNSAAFGLDDSQLVSAGSDGDVLLWDIGPAREVYTIDTPDALGRTPLLSKDGKLMAEGVGTSLIVWDVETGDELYSFSQDVRVNGSSISPDGRRVAFASEDGLVKILDLASQKIIRTINTQNALVIEVAYSPDGKMLVTSGEENLAKVWSAETGEFLFALPGLGNVTYQTFSPDGSMIATADTGRVAILWDANTGKRIRVLLGHDDIVWGVGFSADGKRLVTASRDSTAKIWDMETGKLLFTLAGHTSTVTLATFNPDGTRVATASMDGTTKVWDAQTGELLLTLFGDGTGIGAVEFANEGKRLITASGTGLRMYVLDLRDLIALAQSRLTRGMTTDECREFLHMDACSAAP